VTAAQRADLARVGAAAAQLRDSLELALAFSGSGEHAWWIATHRCVLDSQEVAVRAQRAAQSLSAGGATPGKYDPAARRRGVRRGAERGCWLFVPADELRKAGVDPYSDPPSYRTWGSARGSVVVRFYKEA